MSYNTTTLATLRGRIRERLMAQFWADAELNIYIIEALRVWNILAGYNRNSQTNTISSGTIPFYNISLFTTTGIILLRIESGNTHLDPVSIWQLGTLSPTWMTDTSANTPNYWMHTGFNVIAVNPIPTNNFSATAYYIDSTTFPCNDTDLVQVGEEDLPAIIDYVTFVARLKEGGKEVQDAIPLLQSFLKQAAKYNGRLLFNAIYRKVLGIPYQRQARPDYLDTQHPR